MRNIYMDTRERERERDVCVCVCDVVDCKQLKDYSCKFPFLPHSTLRYLFLSLHFHSFHGEMEKVFIRHSSVSGRNLKNKFSGMPDTGVVSYLSASPVPISGRPWYW